MTDVVQPTEVVFRRSKRLSIRPNLAIDIEPSLRWINDPEVTQYLGAYLPMMEADQRERFDGLHKKKSTDLVFTIVVDGKAIGFMGLHGINWKDRVATTGALIGEKEYWGKGYGTEAKMLLLDFAFNTLDLHKICSNVIEFNGRSERYSEKCGYVREGVRKSHIFAKGRRWDLIELAVFRETWEPLWELFAKEHNISA